MLQEAERTSVAAVAKKHGVSNETIYKRRRKYRGMDASDAERLQQLEQENARLKKMLAERELAIDEAKEIAAKNWRACRHAARWWRTPGRGAFHASAPASC